MHKNRHPQPQLHLASKSPRRAQLLRQLGLQFQILPAEVPEVPLPGQSPADYALAVAQAKARVALSEAIPGVPVLAADTDVSIDGSILGKPSSRDEALSMLERLSGRTHTVCSAVVVMAGSRCESALSVTRVRFGRIDPALAAAYWESGEPADKAGSYAIQGYAARWVLSIEGSYSGVVGLPLYETCDLLERFGLNLAPPAVR